MTTTTDRTTGLLLRSDRLVFEERLTDGDFIVVEVFGEPLLGQGLLGVLDVSLRGEVVVGLITCGRVLFGQGGPSSSAEVRGIVIHDIKEVEGEREEQEDKRDEEIGDEVNREVEEVTQRAHET